MPEFISESQLSQAEEMAVAGDSALHQYLARCVSEVRRLRHELNDPNYSYSGRIHRQAILCRNVEIDALRERVKQLEASRGEGEVMQPAFSCTPGGVHYCGPQTDAEKMATDIERVRQNADALLTQWVGKCDDYDPDCAGCKKWKALTELLDNPFEGK
jgi:hypothetical protein